MGLLSFKVSNFVSNEALDQYLIRLPLTNTVQFRETEFRLKKVGLAHDGAEGDGVGFVSRDMAKLIVYFPQLMNTGQFQDFNFYGSPIERPGIVLRTQYDFHDSLLAPGQNHFLDLKLDISLGRHTFHTKYLDCIVSWLDINDDAYPGGYLNIILEYEE